MTNNRCLSCDRVHNTMSFFSYWICQHCANQIPWILDVQCKYCGRDVQCLDCQKRQSEQKQTALLNRAAVRYDHRMKKWLAQFKYYGDERWANLFADMMWLQIRRQITKIASIALITYVPLSIIRLKDRTFNQTERIAVSLSDKLKIPQISMLDRMKETQKQSAKSKSERELSIQGVFKVDEFRRPDVEMNLARIVNPYILIIDDVYTTGSTLRECAKILSETFPAQIISFTWARA